MSENEPPPAQEEVGDDAGDNVDIVGDNVVGNNGGNIGGNAVDPSIAAAHIAAGVNNIGLEDPGEQVIECQVCCRVFRGADALLFVLGHTALAHGAAAPPIAPQRGEEEAQNVQIWRCPR